jgi:hypothetical protein
MPPPMYHQVCTPTAPVGAGTWSSSARAAPAGSSSESEAQTIGGPLAEVAAQATTASRRSSGGVLAATAIVDRWSMSAVAFLIAGSSCLRQAATRGRVPRIRRPSRPWSMAGTGRGVPNPLVRASCKRRCRYGLLLPDRCCTMAGRGRCGSGWVLVGALGLDVQLEPRPTGSTATAAVRALREPL